MRIQLSKCAGLFLLTTVIFLGCSASISPSSTGDQQTLSSTSKSINNVIVQENALQGTTSWEIPAGSGATTEIQAYAGATSVQPGQSLSFYVSTQIEGTPYSLGIYRLGWYGGLGGRLKFLLSNQIGHAQGYFDKQADRLMNCRSCHTDKDGRTEANWQPSYTLTVPSHSSDWVTGIYLAKFADANGKQTYVPFDVRGNDHSKYILVTSDTTYQAYNQWGGLSLYDEDTASAEGNGYPRAAKVSFDRPYLDGYGSGHVLLFETPGIRWLERMGYDLSYMSSVDLHEYPQTLLQHRAYLSLGHDEYWTKEMRDGVEQARNKGVSLGFFGANTIYWQMRFEPDSAGRPDRTIVCYKVETGANDLREDPFYGKDNSRVTSQWRDPVVNRPENAVVGIMYSSLTHKQLGFPWEVDTHAKSPLLDGTDLQPGQSYGCGLVGYEWDHVFANGSTPANLQIIGTSHTINNDGNADFSNTTYYIAPSEAIVFAAGSIYWTTALDSYRLYPDKLCNNQSLVVPGIQKLTEHVMAVLISHKLS